MKIWKFELPVDTNVEIEMPFGSKVIHVGSQENASVCLWAIVDPNAGKAIRKFRVYGTGYDMQKTDGPHNYIGTTQDSDGLVWHVFGMN